jgi:elongation factor 1-alpha
VTHHLAESSWWWGRTLIARSLQNGDAAFVRLVPLGPLCVEAFGQCPALGRFVLRDNQQTVAVGMVKSVTRKR